MVRKGYEGVAVAVPVTVPYQRYSTRGAHYFIGSAMHALVQESGVSKDQIDGLCITSFSLEFQELKDSLKQRGNIRGQGRA